MLALGLQLQCQMSIVEDILILCRKMSQSIQFEMLREQADFRLEIIINVLGEQVITDIDLSVVSGHTFLISGFPRALMQKPSPIRKSC